MILHYEIIYFQVCHNVKNKETESAMYTIKNGLKHVEYCSSAWNLSYKRIKKIVGKNKTQIY